MASRRRRGAKIALYALVKSTPLESNKSLVRNMPGPVEMVVRRRWQVHTTEA
jgi:hypothetical protein